VISRYKWLCQIPSFAIEMINRGWTLRNEIIWWKPSCRQLRLKIASRWISNIYQGRGLSATPLLGLAAYLQNTATTMPVPEWPGFGA